MQIGAYEVEAEIARGGAGVVYRARHRTRGTPVAIKVLLAPHSEPAEIERFRREAEATFRLRHPHVVGVLEFDYHEGHPYLVLELIEGESLQGRIEREGTIVVEDLCRIGEQVADALHYAHSMGLVHRDIKPHNILIEAATGRAVLTDFGIAQFANDASKETLTVTGEVVGTPAYMAPEQALGDRERVGPHSDVYSLAATLYAGLCGRPPFDGELALTVMQQVVTDPPPNPLTFNPRANPALTALCMQCLAKAPNERGHDAESLREALRDLFARTTGTGGARYARPSSKAPLVISGVVVAATWLAIGLALGRSTAPAPATPTLVAPPPPTPAAPQEPAWWDVAPPAQLDLSEAASPQALFEAGFRALLADRPLEARKAFEQVLADAPERGTPGLLWALSLAQERLGEWEEVLRSAQELASRIPDSPLPRQAQARALLALRRYGEALSRLEGDASPAAAVLRARAALRLQPSDPEAARSALGEVDPEDPAFDAWPAAGELFEPGDPRREALLLARLERHPRDVLGWVDLAHLIRRRPGRDELIRRLREADSHEPFHPRIRELGIAAQLERDGTVHLPERNEEASLLREQLRVIARQDPDRWRAQFLRAQLALEFSDGDEAEQALSAGFGSLYLDLAVANAVAAMLKLDRGEVARGLELSRYAESLAPEFPLAKLAGLRGNLIAGNYPAAGDFAAWLRQNAQEAVPPLEWAKLLLNQDLPRAASVELARNPQRTVEHVLLEACVAHRLGDPARAESLLRQVHDVRGGIYTSYALELFAQTRLGASTEPLMRLRQEAARESDRRLQEGNLESAIEYCAQLLWLADDPRLHARRARLRLFQGEPAQALLDLRLLMRSKSPDTDALLALLGESALRLRRTGFALAVAQELEHRSPEGLATATLLQARAYELLGFTERGLAACERGLGGANTSAPSPRLRGARGMLLERAGRYAEAIADLEAALAAQPPAGEAWSIFPRGSMVCTSLGRALLETGKVDDAERAFKRSGELSVAEHKGVARYGDALGTALLQAIMVEGHAVAAVTGLLECHLARGQEAEARAALRQALRFVLEGHQPRPEDAETLERATLRLR